MREKVTNYITTFSQKKEKNYIEKQLMIPYTLYKKMQKHCLKSNNKTVSRLYLRSKYIEKKVTKDELSFVTVDELVIWTTEWLKSFEENYDIIIGVPRSGLLVANMIALKLGKPLTTPDLLIKDCYWKSELIPQKNKYKKVLLVDDSITTGKAMEKSLRILSQSQKCIHITKAALIATNESKSLVDLYYKIIPHPRLFEWNLLHASKGILASDMDGVICENCPPGVDSNEELYIEWIKNAKQYLIPTFEIDIIVSNRLEKYRADTEEWLAKHGVLYKKLVLWSINSKQERKGRYAQNKIDTILKYKPEIIWESSINEAKQIYEATKIPTLCIDEMILFS